MRFISPISALRIVLIHDKVVPDPRTGSNRTVEPGYTVEFKIQALSPLERELAQQLSFVGGVRDRRNIDGSPYDPINTVSVFDTEWIEDEKLRRKVEEQMLKSEWGCGNPSTYLLVEQPRTEAPWPSYDELTIHGQRNAAKVAETNLQVAAATGVDLEQLIAYERENRNDKRIIEAYEAARAEQEAAEPAEELVQA